MHTPHRTSLAKLKRGERSPPSIMRLFPECADLSALCYSTTRGMFPQHRTSVARLKKRRQVAALHNAPFLGVRRPVGAFIRCDSSQPVGYIPLTSEALLQTAGSILGRSKT